MHTSIATVCLSGPLQEKRGAHRHSQPDRHRTTHLGAPPIPAAMCFLRSVLR